MNTRKYPRTMQEAFGPYTDYKLTYRYDKPMDKADKIVLFGCYVALVVVIVLVLAGVIS